MMMISRVRRFFYGAKDISAQDGTRFALSLPFTGHERPAVNKHSDRVISTTVSLHEFTVYKFVLLALFRCRVFYSATAEVFLRSRFATLSGNRRGSSFRRPSHYARPHHSQVRGPPSSDAEGGTGLEKNCLCIFVIGFVVSEPE